MANRCFYVLISEGGSRLKIFDAHSDVLYKMWLDPSISFVSSDHLHISLDKLINTNSKVQCFAIYIPETVKHEQRFDVALEMIQIFYAKVIPCSPKLKLVRNRSDIEALSDDEIGAMLTLEGCDAIGANMVKLQTLIRLGVASVGLTWNYANAVADGILEGRGAGLSSFGHEVVHENNKHFIMTDVSHISIKGFWDVIEHADYPIASHSNAFAICKNPRNLDDEQIRSLISVDGMIGVTFVPQFLSDKGTATISDVLKHVDHICGLGGEYNLGFGSDFDGITQTVNGLENYNGYEGLINTLLKYYKENQVKRFLFENYLNHLPI
ncbi:dipeptidase [Bacillus luteolus]|uniref:Dipeptidase n=1 Tax=Litchfieldia luteola TaxID=682179 RepID=A0ABR9QJH2_9BACI|nr:dipeptidase [Cytobacillus luteolus]MBE4908653.1 dipeptidase [Cytobacillus luteolus]